MIYFRCPTCHASLRHPAEGAVAKCPKCGLRFRVPAEATVGKEADWQNQPPPIRQEATEAEKATAGPGEKYCRACGTVLHHEAELCPKCGVRQQSPRVVQVHVEEDFDGEPHRGWMILALGIVSLFTVPFVLGPLTWIWGNQDLRKMNAGVMDPRGRGLTEGGKVCGMISTILSLAAAVVLMLYALFALFCFGALVGTQIEMHKSLDRALTPEAPGAQAAAEAFLNDVKANDVDAAYARMSQQYKKNMTQADFANYLKAFPILASHTSHTVQMTMAMPIKDTGAASVVMQLHGAKGMQMCTMTLIKEAGDWKVQQVQVQ